MTGVLRTRHRRYFIEPLEALRHDSVIPPDRCTRCVRLLTYEPATDTKQRSQHGNDRVARALKSPFSEAMIRLAMIDLINRRPAREPTLNWCDA
jgi:hypothetical protein